jgi:phosphoserine phosphatase RsbU/P
MRNTILYKKVPLLSDLPRSELDMLSTTLQVVKLDPGDVLFSEGQAGDCLFIILDGHLEVLLAMGTSAEKHMATLGPGEFVGEMCLLIPGRARTASVRVLKHARLWKMTQSDFEGLLLRQPKFAYTMVRTLTQRLDSTNSRAFSDLQEKNIQLQAAYNELKAAHQQIVEKERLERELQVAAEIQISILPQELPQVPGYAFGAVMHPARLVGGDFYDIFPIDANTIGAVIGDVTDKGVPSAIFMARTHALIMSEASHGGTPAQILRRVNHHLIHLAQSDLFVTVLFGILDCASGKFDFGRAGHEHPLLLAENGKIQTLPHSVGQPVGIFDDFMLDENSLVLLPGSSLLFFTDGVTDSRSPQGEVFGYERLQKALIRGKGKNGQKLCNTLMAALRKFQANAPQEDDITLVVLHREA